MGEEGRERDQGEEGKGEVGKGRDGRGRERKGEEGRGRDGKGRAHTHTKLRVELVNLLLTEPLKEAVI